MDRRDVVKGMLATLATSPAVLSADAGTNTDVLVLRPGDNVLAKMAARPHGSRVHFMPGSYHVPTYFPVVMFCHYKITLERKGWYVGMDEAGDASVKIVLRA